MIGSADRAVRPASQPWAGRAPWRALVALGAQTDARAAGALALAAVAFYWPLVLLGRAIVDYDAFVFFYPQRAYLARSLLAGRLPLWDPALFMGAPFLANPQTAVLYPPSWLFVLGPVETIYGLQLVLHAFLAAFFTYLFARYALGTGPLAAVLAGLAYAFGGFAVGQQGHLNQISAAAWLPAILLGYERFVSTRRPAWIAAGALALALQLLAGHPQETYMSLIVLVLYGLIRAPWRWPVGLAWHALGGAGVCLLGGLLAAAQLLPTLELTPLSIRGQGVNWDDAVAGSLPTYLAVRALLPPYWVQVPNTEYLGYAGMTPVVLGLLALLGGRGRGVLFGALLCGLGIVLALGENCGVYAWLFGTLPGFDTFRVPARWLLLWEFGTAVLAALGADWIGRGAHLNVRRWTLWPRVLLVVVVLVIGLAWQRDQGEPFAQRRTPLAFAGLALAALAAGALPHLGRPALALGALVALTGGEVWAAANASPARQAPPPAYSQGETVDWLAAHGVGDAERLLSLARPEYVPASEPSVRAQLSSLPGPQVDAVLVAQKWHDTLTPNVPLQFGLNTADGYDGGVLPLLRWLELSGIVVNHPRPDGVLLTRLDGPPDDRTLDLLGVRYVVANAGSAGRPDLEVVDFGDLRLLARPSPVPRSLVVYGATVVPDDGDALSRLAGPSFDPNREVVLATAPTVGGATGDPSRPAPPVQATLDEPQRWQAHLSLPQAGYLLQREAYYPGWRARVDGQDVPLLRADVLFRAVFVGPGEHDVEVYFDSASFDRGALLSGLGLLVGAGLLGWPLVGGRHWRRRGGRVAV